MLAARKSTLFLDEAGDPPLVMQGAFLRALELRRFRPVRDEMPGYNTGLGAVLTEKAELPSLRAWKAQAEEEGEKLLWPVIAAISPLAACLAGEKRL